MNTKITPLFMALGFCLCCPSCVTTQSIMKGGTVESQPVLESGKFAPVAKKNRDGSLTLRVYYATTRNSTMGPMFQAGTQLPMEQKIFIADPSRLQPAKDVVRKRFPHYDEPMLATMFADTRTISGPRPGSGSLKFAQGWPANGSHLVCPSEECIIHDRDFIWYVPKTRRNAVPMALVIPSPSEAHTPLHQIPLRIALLPLGLMSDVAINTWLVAATASGQAMDL